MSSSGYRGRSFGPRGARTNGPANGFNGPRFPHPTFNHPRPPHRLSGHDKWIERPNFVPWQQNKNFHPHPQYRGNLQYRSNSRGRSVSGRGIIRFSGPGRPPALQYGIGFIRNPVHRTLSPEEQVEDRPALISQTPLLGSEEERQQKISETADKLKQKLSSITEEELTNFWEDDLSVLPNNNSEKENSPNKGIPELRHEPPELDLTFTDFRDIGRVDCNNSKFENVDSKSNNDISSNFEQKSTDDISISTNDDIIIVDESKEEFVITLDSSYEKDEQDQSNILLEDDTGFKQVHHELPNLECNIENLQLQDDNVAEDFVHSDVNDVDRNVSTSNLNENIKNLLPIESTDNLITDKPSSVNDVETTSMLPLNTNDQDRLQVDFLQNQNNVQLDIQDINVDIIKDATVDVKRNEHTETKLPENDLISDSSQTSVCQDETHKNVVNVSDSPQNKPSNFLPSSEETSSNTICDSSSPLCSSNHNEVHKVNDDKKLNNSLVFQPRVFNIPTRFTQRAVAPRCRWTFQQNGKNLFFRGPQRLPFLGNRMPTPRHVLPFKTPDIVPVGFDPRAPPPFLHNVPVSSHDTQHKVTVPFSSNDLPPAFDPSEPPPNIRPKSGLEPSNVQEKSMPPLVNTPQSNLNVTVQPPPAFNPRGPPPRILPKIPGAPSEKLPEFNPQQPPPKIHKREETLQPPPIFDPRLSSHERSNLITPLDTSRTSIMPLNLIETSPVADFNIASVTPVFSQLPPINIPAHQSFISNMSMNFRSVLPQTNGGQGMMPEFPLPPPSLTMTEVPPPPPKESSMEVRSNLNQNINMDDGLEDMQEAMEFAKQIMNLTEETKNNDESSVPSEVAPLEIPVPTETIAHSSTIEKERISTVKKERKKENRVKKSKQNIICGPELILEKQEEVVIIDEKKSIEDRRKTEEALLSSDQIRPKVVFNLNTKTKKIQKLEEWQKTPINEIRIIENRETFQSSTTQRFNKQRVHSRQHSTESRRSNTNQNKNQQKENGAKRNTVPSDLVASTVTPEKLSNTYYHHKNYTKDSEKLHLHSPKVGLVNNLNTQKNQKSKKENRKEKLPVSESSWKNRVISRFLKMSKNDICNMVNNSSLRKFDIAMKHLVKERRSSLSLELRNTEDEKMKEYDREEFMNQLNAMLDPSAVVGITDLPTEFIHHLSEVLQLDSMPCDPDIPETQNPKIDQVQIVEKDETSRVHASEDLNEDNPKVQSSPEHLEPKSMHEKHVEEQLLHNKEEPVTHRTLNAELNLNISREETSSSHRSLSNKINPEMEGTHKKQQQPLFNEADLDDILSEVTGKTKNLSQLTTTMKPVERTIETCIGSSLMQTETEEFGHNTFLRDSNKTAADLDDIFSAGIARVKLLGKTNYLDCSSNLRIRKSSSEDRNTLRPEKYEKWHRKERDDPDMFRNLTKEEWEAKYGFMSATTVPAIVRLKCVSNSSENLNKDDKNNHTQRHCSSDSPTRRLSVSPLSYEVSAYDFPYPNETVESRRTEHSETSSDSSSSSSSDTDQETTVAPDVTKLLKVIKQKEKIAKKRSINETIRDEVAAEIEKKWKEKGKHKERKSCKREKRKRDKKERRRKEKRKKRKRDSYSESSRSGDKTEGSRLLAEGEIKKEVIIKEEPINSLEENVASNVNNTYVVSTSANKTVHSQIDHCSQVEKEQRFLQLPVEKEITCDTASSQTRSKPVIVSVMVQPKTKAQLKQMPEVNAVEQKQLIEKVAEVANNIATNVGNDKMEVVLETNKYNESDKSNNKWDGTTSPMAISLQQIDVSSNVKNPLVFNQSDIEVISHDNTAQTTTLAYSASNSAAEVSANNEYVDKKTSATTSVASSSSTESKIGSYKKIDIKAYKERALQRRLKEQAMLKGDDGGKSVSLIQEPQATLPINKSNIKLMNTTNETNTIETDTTKVQSKDSWLTRLELTSTLLLEESDKKVKATANLNREDRPIDVTRKTKEPLIPLESRSSGNSETSVIRSTDSYSLHIFGDPIKHKDYKRNNKSSSQEKVATRELNESVEKERSKPVPKERKLKSASEERKSKSTLEEKKSKPASEEKKLKPASEERKLKKQISVVDSSKFKYIRSEGGKELKLKKEKTRRSNERSRKNSASKSTDSKSSIAEKHVESHSHKNVSKDNQVSSIINKNTIEVTQTESEKTNSRDVYEHLSTLRSTCSETCSDPEWAINSRTVPDKTVIHSAVKQTEQSNDDHVEATNVREKTINEEIIVQVNETVPPNQPAADQETATAESAENLTNSRKEENAAQQVDKDAVKATATSALSENTFTESLSKQENVLSMGSIFIGHTQSDSTDEHVETVVVSPIPRGESHSLSERIDVDIEKNGHTINIKDLKNVGIHSNNSLPLKRTASQVVDENDSTNMQRNEKNAVKLTCELYETVENSEECDSVTRNEVSSPDSPRSPFKGFLMDSIDNDICQASPLYDVTVNNKSDTKDVKKVLSRWLDARLDEKPTLQLAEGDKSSSKDSLKRTEEDNEMMSTCDLLAKNENIMDQAVDSNVNVTDNTKVDTIVVKVEEGKTAETNRIYDISPNQKKSLSAVDTDNHDALDGNNEPLIVLDKHSNDGNVKSTEKLSALDLEDCIARDANVFTVEPLRKKQNSSTRTESPNFNVIDFKELSETFSKSNVDVEQNQNNVTAEDEREESVLSDEETIGPPELFAFEEGLKSINTPNIVNCVATFESSSKISKNVTKTIDSFSPEFSVTSLQNVASTSSKDIHDKSTTSELFVAEGKTSEEEDRSRTNTLRNNLQRDLEAFEEKNETLPKLNIPKESTTKTSQSLQNAASTSETSTECLKVNKQQEPDNALPNKLLLSVPSEVRIYDDKDTTSIPSTVKYDKLKHLSKTSLTKSSQRGNNEALRKIKNKSKLKHKTERRDISKKAIKKAVKSDIVNVNHPSTKEAIMARMIEIDVEIHKLMTEKMTLYQILTSDVNLPSDENLQKNNTAQEEKTSETLLIRPRTPSVLMSQLIQNIETSPVKNQCAKTTMETLSTKDSSASAEQLNKSKTSVKHDHYTERRRTSTCGSDDGGNVHHPEDFKSSASKKSKRQRSEKAVNRLESKPNSFTSITDTDNVVAEKKQTNDAMKLILKKINAKEATMQQDSSQVSVNEARPSEDTSKTFMQQIDKRNSPDDEKVEIIVESAESQTSTEEIVQRNVTELDDESCLMKDNEERTETLNEKSDANSSEKPSESRTSERSSIYSDDSTWDSLFQHSNVDEQKRSSTGLALLEETYRKEMAKTRKIKAAMRRKKKIKLQNLLEAVNTITSDEEELPLSALYAKKLHQKKKLLRSFEQQAELQMDDDPQLWKNVVEVINAVAENRTEDLYVRSLGGRSTDNKEGIMSSVPELEDSEFKRDKEEQTIESLATSDTGETSVKSSRESETVCENKDDTNNEPKKDNVQFASCKSQEFLNDKHFQQDLEVTVSTEVSRNLSGMSACDTSTNIETNVLKPLSVQQTIGNDNAETNKLTSIRALDSSSMEINSNDIQSVRNISENSDAKKIDDKIETEVIETNLEQLVIDIEIEFGKNAITREPASSESVVTSGDVEKSYDELLESISNKDTIVNEAASKEEPDTKVENMSDKKLQDSSISSEKSDNINNVYADSNYASQNEQVTKVKEQKETDKGKEIESSNAGSNEENNNQNCASVSSATENTEILRTDEISGKKLQKRKRENSKTSLRRSSRYVEEYGKRIKVEADMNAPNIELEVQEKNIRTQFPSISSTSSSPCEEIETIWINTRKSRSQRPPNRKRGTPVPQDVEILCSNGESLKGIKRHKQHIMSEIMNCMVKVIDCKHTILNPNVKPNVLQQYGISRVNTCMHSNSAQIDLSVSSMQSTSTEELSILYSKQTTGSIESPQCQTSKSSKRLDDTTQSSGEQINSAKIRKRAAKVDSSASDKEECTNFDIEVVPVLTKESVTVDTAEHCRKPDVEIVEERMMVTKNLQQSNSGSTLTVIDTTDDKEYPRTQYTVHKGPILDIKVFENSFLAASEDGRIYRYNQASNGILNIYKGHTAAVTCLYVYKTHSADLNKEWMFSGSLDGTLRCYNIVTGVQVRDTADVSSPIQCMDEAWGKIFIGTKSGHVSRYHVKSGIIKGNTIQFSDKSVLALKATNEGPRRVLIVASRSQPITIRDAQSGLFLRTICGQKSHTVYSLMRDNNLIYCGTSSTSIPVFDFTNGEQTMQYDAGVGIVCMRLYKQLLFAGCYDGNIYVFDTKDRRLICSIPGPGNMLLSMEVIDNKIIAGSKDKRLQSWQMPRQVRSLL